MRKIFSILFALVLVLSFSLVTAVPVAADTINVPTDYDTIQAAINAAGPDDTIIVAAGTYVEDLTIPGTKTNLELVGAEGTVIKGVQWGEWPTHVPGIDVLASGVKIHGFTIESPDYPAGKHSSGIIVGAANVEIYENSFVIKDDGSGDGWGVSIETYGTWAGDVSGLYIHDNTFTSTTGTDKGSEGIYINYNPDIPDPSGTVTIANNTFGGQIFRAITTERSKTTISGNTISSSYAPFVEGNPYSAALRGIDISSTVDNLNPNQDTVVMTGNTINGFYWGFCLGATGNILTNISVTNNTVETNTVGIKVRSSAGGVVVNNNNINGNTLYGVENADTDNTLDATNNWWGDADGPTHETNPLGDGDAVSDFVNFTPFLTQAPSWVKMTAQGQAATPPTVATNAASDVAFTLATLNGNLTNMGTATSVDVSFVYGTTSIGTPSGDKGGYDSETSPVSKGTTDTFTASPTGLTAGQTYYFRAKAKGNDVVAPVYGSEVSFTTAAITTLDATDIGAYTATLNGRLDIGSATSVDVDFEWGETTAYGSTAPATPIIMTESGDFSADLTDLILGATYHFQALGEVDSDIGEGGDKQFTTAQVIGISVSPTSIDFGDIIAGHSSATKTVTVTNEGDADQIFTAELIDEDPAGFYSLNLKIDDGTVLSWESVTVLPSGFVVPGLVLSIPIATPVGPKTATLVFWAEAAPY